MIDILLFIVCLNCNIKPDEIIYKRSQFMRAKKLFTLIARRHGFANIQIADRLKVTHGSITSLYYGATTLSKVDDSFKRSLEEIEQDLETSIECLKEYQRTYHAKRVRSF